MFFTKFLLVVLMGVVFWGKESLSAGEEKTDGIFPRLTVFDPLVGLSYYGDASQAEVSLNSVERNLPTAQSTQWCLFEPQAFERPCRQRTPSEKAIPSSPMEGQAPMLVPQAHVLIPESVVAEAEHTLIPDPHGAGWASIGHLEMQLFDQEGNLVRTYIGTGQLVGPNIVLTAGHNLWLRVLQTGFSRIIFHPGRVGESIPWRVQASSFVVHPEYMSGKEETYKNYDIGLIILEDPVGYRLGWARYGHAEDEKLTSQILSLVGYPSMICEQSRLKEVSGTHMFHGEGPVVRVTKTQLYYKINTFGGHSGSGVLDEGGWVRAVHAYGGTKETGNCGTRISQVIEDLIKKWTEQFASDPHSKAPPAFQTRRATALARRLTEGKIEEGLGRKAPVKLKTPLKRLQLPKKKKSQN